MLACMLRSGLLLISFLLLSLNQSALANIAEKPIPGGLGVTFGQAVPLNSLGSEIPAPYTLPDNKKIQIPDLVPGAILPWRQYLSANLPRPFRTREFKTFVMVDDANEPMRVTTAIEFTGCEGDFTWLKDTLLKKYSVTGETAVEPKDGYSQAYRITFSDYQIDFMCGSQLVIDYGNYGALRRWAKNQRQAFARYQREQSSIEKRQIVLDRRRAMHFADTFTIGDRYRLSGAFGIAFNQPFAPNSTQQFPVDRPFIAVLPGMPTGFEDGEVALEITPERIPIVIRGTFSSLEFERVADALKSKYGTPMKASDRHVIHKVGSNRAILKKLPANRVELAFIDMAGKEEQQQRLWEQESDGL